MEFLIRTIKNIKPRRIIKNIALLLGFTLLLSANTAVFSALSHDQSLHWHTLVSKHFELHYHDGEYALAEKSINIAEKVLQELQPTFNWVPSEKIEIILSDEIDKSNGFVIAPFLPSLRITLYPTVPDSVDSVSELNDWLTLLITHELTHALHVDKAQGKPLSLRKIFGRHPLLFPNILQPPWILEGLATYKETDPILGSGRGQDDIFGMMMRMEVEKGIKPYEQVNIDSTNWPAGTTRYLYGVHFFQFLKSQYSEASISRLVENYSNNLLPFALNENSTLVYGKTMPELWQDFEEYLNKKYLPQIAYIKKDELIIGEQLTHNGYYKNYVQPIEDGHILYAQYDGKSRPALLLQKPDINQTEIITEIRSDARLDYHPDEGVIVAQTEIYRNTNYFYDLFKVDLNDNKIQRLTRGERYRRGSWSPDGEKIVAVHNRYGIHTLALLNNDGRLIDLLWEGKDGEYIADLDWSPDSNFIVASVKRHASSWNIEEFSLEKRTWKSIIASDANEVQPRYNEDGSRIIFSANFNQVYNIHQYDKQSKTISTITNVIGGAFKPVIDNNYIYYLGYTANGYDIFRVEADVTLKNVEIYQEKQKNIQPIPDVQHEKLNYSSFSHLTPTWWSPSIAVGDNISLFGAYFTGSDALNIHTYDSTIAFDFDSNTISAELNYTYDRWFPLLQTHISSVNRKLRSQEIAHIELLAPLLQREKYWYFGTTLRREKLRYSDTMNHPNEEDYLLGAGIIYDTRKHNLISNSPSNGRLFTMTSETSELFGSDFRGKMLITKWQEYIALKPEHVLAFRFVSGIGVGSPRKFQLGGNFSDGNYYSVNPFSTLPFRTTLYNERLFALRGYAADTPSLLGRRMMMYNLEWRFPIKRTERSASSFPVGMHQISGTIFMDSGAAWEAGLKPNDFHYSIGTEIKWHSNLFYLMPVTFRTGYAYGLDERGEQQFYLQVGSSF